MDFYLIELGNINLYIDRTILTPYNWMKFLLLNVSQFGGHLWYLSALLYCNIIYYFYKKFMRESIKKEIIIFGSLLIIGTILAEIIGIFFANISIKYIYYRNFLFFGLPYYFLGIVLKKVQVEENSKKYIISTVVSLLLYLLEISIIYKVKDGLTLEYYFTGIFLSINIILCAISYKNCIKENNLFAVLGRKYSLIVYIIHLGCINISTILLSKMRLKPEKNWIICFLLTILISFMISAIVDWLKNSLKILTTK